MTNKWMDVDVLTKRVQPFHRVSLKRSYWKNMTRTGDIIGYARDSTTDQYLASQRDRLFEEGAVRIFEDVVSGKTFDRPGLSALLDYARSGDTLAVIRLDRLG